MKNLTEIYDKSKKETIKMELDYFNSPHFEEGIRSAAAGMGAYNTTAHYITEIRFTNVDLILKEMNKKIDPNFRLYEKDSAIYVEIINPAIQRTAIGVNNKEN